MHAWVSRLLASVCSTWNREVVQFTTHLILLEERFSLHRFDRGATLWLRQAQSWFEWSSSLPLGQRSLHNQPRVSSTNILSRQVIIPIDGALDVVLHLVYPPTTNCLEVRWRGDEIQGLILRESLHLLDLTYRGSLATSEKILGSRTIVAFIRKA